MTDLVASLPVAVLGVGGAFVVSWWERRRGVTIGWPLRLAAGHALMLGWMQGCGMVAAFTGALTTGVAWSIVCAWAVVCGAAAWAQPSRPRGAPRAAIWWAFPLAATFLMATVPPWDRDEMVYHLALPRYFAAHRGYATPDDNIFASMPLGWETALTVLHALRRDSMAAPLVNPRLVGAWTGLNVALATTGLARALGARRLAPWAGLAWLTVPTAIEFSASAYVEPYLALDATLALAALALAARKGKAFDGPAIAFAASCAAVKYSGLLVFAFVAAGLVAVARTRRDGASGKGARGLVLVVGSLALASPFYVRNVLERGNPVFPVAFGIFGGRGWDDVRAAAYVETLARYGYGRDLLDFALLPLRLFAAYDFRAGFEGAIGPLCGVAALTILVALVRSVARERAREAPPRKTTVARALVGAFVVTWFVFWAATIQQARFFLVAVPPLVALGAASAPGVSPRRWLRRATVAILSVACCLAAAPGVMHLWRRQETSAHLSGALDRDALLGRLMPTSYAAMRETGPIVPTGGKVWLVWMRAYTYYFPRDYRIDCVYEGWRLEELLEGAPDPASARVALERAGITHLLVNHAFFLQGRSADVTPGRTERLRRRWEVLVASGELRVLRAWGPVQLYAVPPR